MKENLVQRELMVRYLLNDLSRVEELQIEESYFTNSAFLRELLAARNELISSYVRGTLNNHDASLFEKLLQSSSSMQEKVNSFRAFLQSIDAISEEASKEENPEPPEPMPEPPSQNASWFSAWLPDPRNLAWAAGALSVTAGVLLGIGYLNQPGLMLLAPTVRPQAAIEALPSEKRTPAGGVAGASAMKPGENPLMAETAGGSATPPPLSAQMAAAAKPALCIKPYFFSGMATRAETDAFELRVPVGVDIVRLHLDVDEDIPAQYEAVLLCEQSAPRTLWQKSGLSARGKTSPMVVCDLPVKKLENGILVLRLRPQPGIDGGEQKYNLNVILSGPNS